MGCRLLVRDYELLPETSETFIYLAMIRIMVRRLAENLTHKNFSNTLLHQNLIFSSAIVIPYYGIIIINSENLHYFFS